jgi:hypothetical protein
MGWIIETVIDWFWVSFVLEKSKGKSWWVQALWLLSPLLVLAGLILLVWLIVLATGV